MPLHAPWIREKAKDHKKEEKAQVYAVNEVNEGWQRTIYQSERRSREKGFPREEKEDKTKKPGLIG